MSAGGRNALLSIALLCLVGDTFQPSLTPDNFVAMTDEDDAQVLSFERFHVSAAASFFCNNEKDHIHAHRPLLEPSERQQVTQKSNCVADCR